MICSKCSADIPDESVYCNMCGRKVKTAKNVKSRANGQGCAYQDRKSGRWVAQVIIGYRPPSQAGHQSVPVKRTKYGFQTKEEALLYCPMLRSHTPERGTITLNELFARWKPWYSHRVGASTMGCYHAAFQHFSSLRLKNIKDLCAGDLQQCMDECELGHRTRQNMKVTAGLLWKYAVDHNYATRNIAENLYVGRGKSRKRVPLSEEEVEAVKQAIATEPYAEYIYALCYLGYRPGEMLEIKKDQVHTAEQRLYIVEGKKTEAGKDRIVPVHKNIENIILQRLKTEGTDYLFPMRVFNHKGEFTGFRQMSNDYFNRKVFKPLMKRLGISEEKVPYSARHTFSNKLKNASGDAMDKARLIGHTDYAFTQEKYQTTSLGELYAIVDSMK